MLRKSRIPDGTVDVYVVDDEVDADDLFLQGNLLWRG